MLKKENHADALLRLNAIFDTATDGIITIDEYGIMELVNPAAARLFGYQADELIGQNVHVLMGNPHHAAHDDYISNYKKTGIAKIIGIGREVNGKRKDGVFFPFRLSISEVKLENRRIFTGIVHDLSEQKLAQERLTKLNEDLEKKVKERTRELAKTVSKLLHTNQKLNQEIKKHETTETALRLSETDLKKALEKEKELNELKSRFVSMASHEFRTPLSSILSSVEIIELYKKEEQQAKRVKHIQRIKSAVNNLTGILNDLLSLSRLEEGKITPQVSEFQLNDFCEEVLDDMKGLLKANQIIKQEKLEQNITVIMDRNILKNILFNLISNAIKYSDEGTSIYTKRSIENKQLKIEIRDEGIGIPLEDQKHLFTRFFRANNVENIKGTGLGLNIVKRYLDLIGGTISFESEEGKGSIFTVSIPI